MDQNLSSKPKTKMLSCFRTTLINFFDALQMLTTVVIVLVIFIYIVLGVNGPLHVMQEQAKYMYIV